MSPHPDLQKFTANYPMLEEIADSKLEGFADDLDNTVRVYCMDPGLAKRAVDDSLHALPSSPSPLVSSIIGWKMLQKTAAVLRNHARQAKRLREGKDPTVDLSAAKEYTGPTIDDKEIRESAGYTQDEDVADSAKTEKAKEHDVTDDDIGSSAREGIIFEDQTPFAASPAEVFFQEARRLFASIVNACTANNRLDIIVESGKDSRQNISALISTMRAQLKELKIPNPDDQMQN